MIMNHQVPQSAAELAADLNNVITSVQSHLMKVCLENRRNQACIELVGGVDSLAEVIANHCKSIVAVMDQKEKMMFAYTPSSSSSSSSEKKAEHDYEKDDQGNTKPKKVRFSDVEKSGGGGGDDDDDDDATHSTLSSSSSTSTTLSCSSPTTSSNTSTRERFNRQQFVKMIIDYLKSKVSLTADMLAKFDSLKEFISKIHSDDKNDLYHHASCLVSIREIVGPYLLKEAVDAVSKQQQERLIHDI